MDSQLLQQLRALVGRVLVYGGHSCRIVEILDGEDSLVLRCEDSERVIQGNQFGEATRRVKRHHTLALFDEHHNLNPVIRAWLQ
jgi:hypothetical protein